MLDATKVRDDFPIFQRKINGKPLIYLDSAATSLKPKPMLDSMWKYYTEYSANIHRGIYSISEEATAAYDEARKKVMMFIGATDEREVIFTRGTTEGLNLIAQTLGKQIVQEGDTIVTTVTEHHANFVPWQQLAIEKKATFVCMPLPDEGFINDKELDRYITAKTKIFAFSAVSNVLGCVQDVCTITKKIKSLNPDCIVVIDAAQSLPHMQIDVCSWGADFVTFSGHKMLGPTGIGVLWGKYKLLAAMPPYQFGGDMIKEVHVEKTLVQDPPMKFEAGTPDIAEAIGLGAAVDYLTAIGMEHIRNHEKELIAYAQEKLQTIEGLRIYGPKDPSKRGGVIAFTLPDIHAHDIAQVLNEDNVCIRSGHHCAMPLHTALGIAATARISVYIYTTKEDIDICIEGLQKAQQLFSKQ